MAGRLSRRQLLLGGAGAFGAAVTAGLTGTYLATRPEGSGAIQNVPTPLTADPGVRDATFRTEWVDSAARRRPVRLVTVTPAGADPAGLPICLGLHGLRSTAAWWSDPGNRRLLGAAFSRGSMPFAVVAVDGGDNYWHPVRSDDDPMRMLLTELPGWLRARRLAGPDGVPDAVAGVSMGGAGALLYARERARAGRPPLAVAAISPGLFTDWRVAARRPFAGEPDWAANDPLRFFPELRGVPTGLWCGDRDAFADAARRYIALARPEIGRISPGRHDGVFYARVLPEVISFIGRRLPRPGPPTLPIVRPLFRPPG